EGAVSVGELLVLARSLVAAGETDVHVARRRVRRQHGPLEQRDPLRRQAAAQDRASASDGGVRDLNLLVAVERQPTCWPGGLVGRPQRGAESAVETVARMIDQGGAAALVKSVLRLYHWWLIDEELGRLLVEERCGHHWHGRDSKDN